MSRAGLTPRDPSGNESGDPLDWTVTQVWKALEDARAGAPDDAYAVPQGPIGPPDDHAERVEAAVEEVCDTLDTMKMEWEPIRARDWNAAQRVITAIDALAALAREGVKR